MAKDNGGGAPAVTQMVKLLGMFGSDFDGEVLNAARKAHMLLVGQDWTWQQLLSNGAAGALTQEQLQRIYSAGMQRGEAVGYQRGLADAAVLAPQGPNPKAELGTDAEWAERVLEAGTKAKAAGDLTEYEADFVSDQCARIKLFGHGTLFTQRQFDYLRRLEQSLRRRKYL